MKGKLTYVGNVGTGFDDTAIKQLLEKFAKLDSGASPFAESPRLDNVQQWLKPTLVCQIMFAEWTDDGLIRQATYLGLRDDKLAKEVTRE